MNRTHNAIGTPFTAPASVRFSACLSARLSALALAGVLTLATLLGIDTLARNDIAPAQFAQAAQARA